MQAIRLFLRRYRNRKISITWIKKDKNSWLFNEFDKPVIVPKATSYSKRIDRLGEDTNKLGPQPLWEGYEGFNLSGPTRLPNIVRIMTTMGDVFTDLVKKRQPNIIVEFGTAFGISGMYFLAGLEANNKGQLLTFEVNKIWAELAKNNLSKIGSRFNLTVGTFEENIEHCLEEEQRIDIAFIDAIHSKEFVIPQLEIVIENSNAGALIILDDINFDENMMECWEEVSNDERFSSSLKLGGRVGLLELKSA